MGKKLIVHLTLFLIILVTGQKQISAQSRIAGSSASFSRNSEGDAELSDTYRSNTDYVKSYMAIRKVLKSRNSPLAESSHMFIKSCITHNLDCYLLPAITGLESGFGHAILSGTHNPFGWGGGRIVFESWDEAIATVAAGLEHDYVGRGAVTIEQIGSRYAASPTWAPRVRSFMAQFKSAEAAGLNSDEFGLEL